MNKRTLKILIITLAFIAVTVAIPTVIMMYSPDIFGADDARSIQVSQSQNETAESKPEKEAEPEPEPEAEPEPESEPEPEPEPESEPDQSQNETVESEPEPDPIVTITISAAGDVTLGGGMVGSTSNFMREFELNNSDHTYFFRNVKHIFDADDLTIVNLEGALTEETRHKIKTFNFRGPPHLAKVLSSTGVECVSLANNHSEDFFEKGYRDTVESLEAEGVAYFGNEFNTVLEIKGIRVGLFGFLVWSDTRENRALITAAIDELKRKDAQLIIGYYHWGIEGDNIPNTTQRNLGRFTIDSGAHLVLGAHPHVIQGIEVYNGKNIVYSLANFSFGGNRNPADKDTFIFQQTFTFDDGVLQDINETNLIPAYISSVRNYNNYQPIPVDGAEADRILQRIEKYSEGFR